MGTPVRRTTALSMTDSTRRMLSSSTPTVATDSSPTPTKASTLPGSTLTLTTRVLDVALSARDTASATTATPTTTATPASPPPNSVDATTPAAARETMPRSPTTDAATGECKVHIEYQTCLSDLEL